MNIFFALLITLFFNFTMDIIENICRTDGYVEMIAPNDANTDELTPTSSPVPNTFNTTKM